MPHHQYSLVSHESAPRRDYIAASVAPTILQYDAYPCNPLSIYTINYITKFFKLGTTKLLVRCIPLSIYTINDKYSMHTQAHTSGPPGIH